MNAALSAIFFLSGGAALLFESLWFRQAGLAFGNSVWASALVLSSFMAGIALGNGLAARHGGRVARPVRLYALLELIVAFTGVGLVFLLPALAGLMAPAFRPLLDFGAALQSLRFLISFGLLLIPATAMGATLPLLVKALTRDPGDFGRVLGLLYGWNTLGGVMGAVIGELVLVSALGVRATGFVAAFLNLLAAAGAVMVLRKRRAVPEPDPETAPRLGPRPRRLLVAAFLAGAILLALEVVWFRFLSLFISGTSRSFAMMLAVVLAGIGAGSLVGSAWLKRRPDAERAAFSVALAAGALAILAYTQFGFVLQYHSGVHSNRILDLLRLSVPLMFPVAFASGVLFPLLGTALNQALGVSVRSAGLLTLANTVGAAIGPLVAGLAMLSWLGMEMSILVLALGYGAVAFFALDKPRPRNLGRVAWTALLAFVLLAALFPVGRMEARYLDLVRERAASTDEVIVALREGPTETIQYSQSEFAGEPFYHRLITNGHSMSSSKMRARRYMRVYAQLPAALHPGIENALLISYGLGTTAQTLTQIPGLRSLDIVDISRDVLEMSDIVYPDPAQHPLRDPRVSVHIEDGRYFLQVTPERFDLITAEPPPLRTSRTVYLYTEEYFRLAYDRLKENGLVSYWLPVFQLSLEETSSIVNAFCAVFEDCSLWSGALLNWTLVGSRGPMLPVRADGLEALWRDETFLAGLKDAGIDQPAQVGALFIGDAEYLRGFAGGTPPLNDDRPLRISNHYPEIPRNHYWNAMSAEAAKQRFQSSDLVDRIWPEALREAALEAFTVQRIIDQDFGSFQWELDSDAVRLRRLHRLLAEPDVESAVFWNLGFDPREGAIARARAEAGGTPEGEEAAALEARLGAAALAERSWHEAARHFGRAAVLEPELEYWKILEIYALARSGQREEAAARLRDTPGSREVQRWLEQKFQLQ